MITPEELSGFLSMHQGFRAEFGRLAVACRAPRDAAHAALLEEQLRPGAGCAAPPPHP